MNTQTDTKAKASRSIGRDLFRALAARHVIDLLRPLAGFPSGFDDWRVCGVVRIIAAIACVISERIDKRG